MPFNRPPAPARAASGPSGLPPAAASQLPRPHGPAQPLPTAPPAPRKTARTGMTVKHPKYGTGTVVRREGEGDDAKITVNFPRFGMKKLVEKYAGLKTRLMNTKNVTDKAERKKLKRAARKKAAPKAKRAAGVARGSMKKKIRHQVQGQRKR